MNARRTRRVAIALVVVATLGALLPSPRDGAGDRDRRPCQYGIVASPERIPKALSDCTQHRSRP